LSFNLENSKRLYSLCQFKKIGQVFYILLLLCGLLQARPVNLPALLGKPPAFCATYPGRILDQLRKDAEIRLQLAQKRDRRESFLPPPALARNVNDVAIFEDDGTIISPVNYFDLSALKIRLTPTAAGSYAISSQASLIDRSNLGTRLALSDDDSREIKIQNGFRFLFFGESYDTLFVNSDGNITFLAGDSASTDRDLTRFNGGPPRLAAFFADLNPEANAMGGVYFNQFPDRLLITWDHVRKYSDNGSTQEVSVQLALLADGSFEITYDSISVESGIVGWTPGGNRLQVNLLDLSASSSNVLGGPQAEKFSEITQVSNTALAQKFYETHPDIFDQLVVFTNFPYDLGNAFAYELNVKNDIEGIGLVEAISGHPSSAHFDYTSYFGSHGQLQSYLSMNQLAAFPDNPDQIFFGTNSTITILGQETGHRWLAYVPFLNNGSVSKEILGRDQDHWSFFFNSEASVMEGNLIRDNGDGSFTTIESTRRYSTLDQYLMGLRPADQVNPFFLVTNVSGTRRNAASAPAEGVTFRGNRLNLSVSDIIAAAGTRVPSVEAAPKVFRQAFVLLIRQGNSPNDSDLNKVSQIKTRWEQFYTQATDGLGLIDSRLYGEVPAPRIQNMLPVFGSTLVGTRVYLSGDQFQDGALVFFGDATALEVRFIDAQHLIAITPPMFVGTTRVRVVNPDGQEALSSTLFTFKELATATLQAGYLRIPFAIDTAEYRSNLGINNLSDVSATAKISLLDIHGNLLKQAQGIIIPPRDFLQMNHILRILAGDSAMTGLEGTLAIEADQELEAFLSQIDNRNNDPAILDGVREGSPHLILESAANVGSFRSTLVVSNLSPRSGRVTLRALSRADGNPVGQPLTSQFIEPNGYLRYDNILETLGMENDYGPVEILSEDQLALSAISLVVDPFTHTSGFFTARPAEAAVNVQYIPLITGGPEGRTNLGIYNPSLDSALIHLSLVDAKGETVAFTSAAISLSSGQSNQINQLVPYLLNDPIGSVAGGSSLPYYLKVASDQPIHAYASFIQNSNNDPAIESGVARGGTRLLIKSAANTNYVSSLRVLNPNDSPVTVLLTARSGDAASSRSINISAHGFFDTDNVLAFLNSPFDFGPVEIRTFSGRPVIAVSRVYSKSDNTSGFFQAQSLPDLYN
jgi:hypothetical protein